MKVVCSRKRLLHIVQAAASIIPGRNVKPILQYLKLEAGPLPSGGSGISISATDLEVSLQAALNECEVTQPGVVAVPGARFTGLLQSGTSEEVALTCTSDKVGLCMGGSKFILPTVRPDEFPSLDTFSGENGYYSISAQELVAVVRRTVFATDAPSSRYQFSGVLFEVDGNMLYGVATDGRRMAIQETTLTRNGSPEEAGSVILQQKGLQLLAKICGDAKDGEEVAFTFERSNVTFRCGHATCCIRQLEGRFPKWRDAVPSTKNSSFLACNGYGNATVATEDMHAALRQAVLVVTEDHIRVNFGFHTAQLVLEAETDNGKTEIVIPVTFDASDRTVGLNPFFVGEFCRAVKEDAFEVYVRDSGSGVLFCNAAKDYRYMIMPLRD